MCGGVAGSSNISSWATGVSSANSLDQDHYHYIAFGGQSKTKMEHRRLELEQPRVHTAITQPSPTNKTTTTTSHYPTAPLRLYYFYSMVILVLLL